MQESRGSIPGSGNFLGEGKGNSLNILAWKTHRQRTLADAFCPPYYMVTTSMFFISLSVFFFIFISLLYFLNSVYE